VLRRQRAEETRVYGENACQALFQSRPEAIVRAWFIQSVTPRFKEALRWMAANRKAYHVVDEAELAKASGTEHHGGVCFLIKKRHGTSVAQWVAKAAEEDCVLALEDVGNPHNLGAIMRSCAHFGVKGVVVQDAGVLESGRRSVRRKAVRSMLNRSPATALSIPWISSAKRATRLSQRPAIMVPRCLKPSCRRKWCWC
jgi:TrmH RNA methyltransferase